MYTIKQVSKKLRITANAVRFYEEKGLIKPDRTSNDYRTYSIEDISKLEMIILYRKMGFPIEAITKLLSNNQDNKLLNQFVEQYNILNHHIHTMSTVRETLGKCVEELLNSSSVNSRMIDWMEQTAEIISVSDQWEDRWNFDSWAENYDNDITLYKEGLNFYQNYDSVIDITAKNVTSGKVVEIGIGTGNLAKAILDNGILPEDYIGIDQSVNMLKEAKKKCPEIELRLGDFLHLPLDNNICDTVVCSYAFHHCNHAEKILAVAEMCRILKPNGRIIITDLMFQDTASREAFEQKCSDTEKENLNDEFFGNIDEVEQILSDFDLVSKHKQIDELIWIIIAQLN